MRNKFPGPNVKASVKRTWFLIFFGGLICAGGPTRERAQSKRALLPTVVKAAKSDCVSTDGIADALKKIDRKEPDASGCFVTPDLICAGCQRGVPQNSAIPCYPVIASSGHASGSVLVAIAVNEEGNVFWARVEKGHPLLRTAALAAALKQTFTPYACSGRPIKAFDFVVYNFERGN